MIGWTVKLVFFCFLLLSTYSVHATEVEPDCNLVLQEIFLHPDHDANSKVVEIRSDEYGNFFVTNVNDSTTSAKEVFAHLGFSEVDSKVTIPSPNYINNRLKSSGEEVDIEFIGLRAGSLSVLNYIRYIGQKKLPIGLKGQLYHDMFDHAVGYYLLSKTPVWSILTDGINELFKVYDLGGSKAEVARRKLHKINSYLEAATPAFILEYDSDPNAYQEFVEQQMVFVQRILN